MRLFVAIDTGPQVAQGVGALLEELRSRVQQTARRARLTWAAPERIHITVRFIGEADEPQTRAIVAALQPPLALKPFDVTVSGIGVFPSQGRPRVIWAGLGAGGETVLDVEREIALRLNPILGPGEERAYTPHITLARVRDAAGLTRRICDGLDDRILGTTHVDASTLFESRMSPKGSTHVPLCRTYLRPGPSTG